jgi:hypothetical protein
MKSNGLTLLAGLSLLLPALFFFNGQDSILYPHPCLVLVPMFFGLRWAAFAVPTLLFFVWNPGLFRGDAEIPKRSYVLLLVATVVNALWFVLGWNDGLAVQGARYTYAVCMVNFALVVLLIVIFARCWKAEPSFKVNLLVHWLLFVWLAWYALPFFGEFI